MDFYHLSIISQYIKTRETFLKFIQINHKYSEVIDLYQPKKNITINSPFKDELLFPNNPGPKDTEWTLIMYNNDGTVVTEDEWYNDYLYQETYSEEEYYEINLKDWYLYLHSSKFIKRNEWYKYLILPSNLIVRSHNIKFQKFLNKYVAYSNQLEEEEIEVDNIIFQDLSSIEINNVDSIVNLFGSSDSFYIHAIEEVKLPSTLTFINNSLNVLFYITKIVLPDSIKEIHNSFNDVRNLRELHIPTSIQTITNSFNNCLMLLKIDIPSTLTKISNSFKFNTCLREINITKITNLIIDKSFKNCYHLNTNIILKNNNLNITNDSFENCNFEGLIEEDKIIENYYKNRIIDKKLLSIKIDLKIYVNEIEENFNELLIFKPIYDNLSKDIYYKWDCLSNIMHCFTQMLDIYNHSVYY